LIAISSGLISVGASTSYTLTLIDVLRQCRNFNTLFNWPGIFSIEQDLWEEVKLSLGLKEK